MIKYAKKIKKILISEEEFSKSNKCINQEYEDILSNPCNRILKTEQIKETEKLMNDEGYIASITDKTYIYIEWEEETL